MNFLNNTSNTNSLNNLNNTNNLSNSGRQTSNYSRNYNVTSQSTNPIDFLNLDYKSN